MSQEKMVPPNLEQTKEWKVVSYNKITKDYILLAREEREGQKPIVIMSCLRCRTKLKPGKTYKGYKDTAQRSLVVQK